jgi:hypothetical protein
MRVDDRRVRFGVFVLVSVLGLTLLGIVARAGPMAAHVGGAPTWGKVLIAGGCCDTSDKQLSSTELYDPATNSFAAASACAVMKTAREDPTATLLISGKVLIAGGYRHSAHSGQGNALSSTELYDPATNSFADGPAMNTARYGSTATLLASGKVLIAGGNGGNGGDGDGPLYSTELYDPATNSFAAGPAMNTPRYGSTATLLGSGKMLIAGGQYEDQKFGDFIAQSSTELYEPTTNGFAAAADMNTARDDATATLLSSGKVLIAGGEDDTASSLPSTELYDPATNIFAAGPAMNTARDDATATLLSSGKVLIAGGQGNNGSYLSSTELYDPATNHFAAPGHTAVMHSARYATTATLLTSGKVLIAGGADTNGHGLSSTELYDPATNSFAGADIAAMRHHRFDAVAILLPIAPRHTEIPAPVVTESAR